MKAVEIIKLDWDTDVILIGKRVRILGTFTNIGGTVFSKVDSLLKSMEPVQPYLGNDGQIYPQFEVREFEID
jgi:hypothetical protein